MNIRKRRNLLWCLVLSALLAAGCGRGDGAGGSGFAAGAEDFYGSWEYDVMGYGLSIYGDGTYEWTAPDGTVQTGTYYMDGDELCLGDGSLRYTLDGSGGLVDSDGDTLTSTYASAGGNTASGLKGSETTDTDSSQDTPVEAQPGYSVTEEDFYGCWENYSEYTWLQIYVTGVWELFQEDGSSEDGTFYMDGSQLCTDEGSVFQITDDGYLQDQHGTMYFRSEMPEFASGDNSEGSGESSSGGTKGYGGAGAAHDPDEVTGDEVFEGYWTYQNADDTLYVFGDGTYEWTYEDGSSYIGTYYMDGQYLVLEDAGLQFEEKWGGIVDQYDELMYDLVPPDANRDGAEAFYGDWENENGSAWLRIYDNGEYLWMFDDGYGSAGDYYMSGDELVLQSGTRLTLSGNNLVDDEGEVLTPSQMPSYLEP